MSDQKKKRGSSRGTVTGKRDSLSSPPTRRSGRNSASLNKSTDVPVPAPVMKPSITAKKIMPRKTLAALAFAESQPKTSSPAQKPATAVATLRSTRSTPKAALAPAESQPKATSTAVVTPRFTPKVPSSPILRRSSRTSPNSEKENAVLESQDVRTGAKDQPVSKIDVLSPIPLNVPQSPSYDERAKVMSQKVRRSYSRLEMSLNGGSFLYSPTRDTDSDTSTPNPVLKAARMSLFGFHKLGSESQEEEAEINLGEKIKQINNKSASGTSMGLTAEEPDPNIPGVPLAKQKRRKRKVPHIEAQYNDKAQNSNLNLESTTNVPIIPPPTWWGDSESPAASQHSDKTTENHGDQSRRIKDKCPGTQPSNQSQEANLNSSTLSQNLEQDKDSLNQKITELLDHLVRAQSTICALEKLNGCDSRTEQKHTGTSKPPLPIPSLLPAHRNPQRNHHSRTSSTESSGDDPMISWTDAPSYEPPLDYNSAQNILDTLLGLNISDTNIAKPEIAGGFSSVDAMKIDGHLIRSENTYLENPKSVAPRTETKHMSYSGVNKDCTHISGKCSQNDSILFSTHSPMPSPVSGDSKLPPLPAKRTSVSGSFGSTCPALNPVGEVGFRPVGKNEGLIHHKSDFLIPTCYLSSSMQSPDPIIQHLDSFMLRSPSGTEPAMGNWETSQSHHQEEQRERKPRKERTVTFSAINDGQSKQSLVTARSKFMSSKIADQGQEDSTSMDSTLL